MADESETKPVKKAKATLKGILFEIIVILVLLGIIYYLQSSAITIFIFWTVVSFLVGAVSTFILYKLGKYNKDFNLLGVRVNKIIFFLGLIWAILFRVLSIFSFFLGNNIVEIIMERNAPKK